MASNPQAFPRTGFYNNDGPDSADTAPQPGMVLRDWFAGQALAGVILHPNATDGSPARCAAVAYALPDAMLAEREKGGGA